jgi:hypothetical protein
MKILLLIIIAVLIVYIIFIQMRMIRKNIFIESIVKSLTGIEKDWKKDELLRFLGEIRKSNYFSSYFKDIPFEDETLSYILDNVGDTNIFIHYTKDEKDAKSILTSGFRFVDTFYKTALPVTDDKLDLIMKHNTRKYFGDYLIVICISNKIIENYSSELVNAGIKNSFIENILTESPPSRNENSDLVYLLPKQFIKGYINHATGEIVKNPDFNPDYNSASFMINIDKLRINV